MSLLLELEVFEQDGRNAAMATPDAKPMTPRAFMKYLKRWTR
jgi:hypothetical protein